MPSDKVGARSHQQMTITLRRRNLFEAEPWSTCPRKQWPTANIQFWFLHVYDIIPVQTSWLTSNAVHESVVLQTVRQIATSIGLDSQPADATSRSKSL
jgi:hypothetical protein